MELSPVTSPVLYYTVQSAASQRQLIRPLEVGVAGEKLCTDKMYALS